MVQKKGASNRNAAPRTPQQGQQNSTQADAPSRGADTKHCLCWIQEPCGSGLRFSRKAVLDATHVVQVVFMAGLRPYLTFSKNYHLSRNDSTITAIFTLQETPVKRGRGEHSCFYSGRFPPLLNCFSPNELGTRLQTSNSCRLVLVLDKARHFLD